MYRTKSRWLLQEKNKEVPVPLCSYSASLSFSLSSTHALAMRNSVFALALVGVFCAHDDNLGVPGVHTIPTNSLHHQEVPSAFWTDSSFTHESAYGTNTFNLQTPTTHSFSPNKKQHRMPPTTACCLYSHKRRESDALPRVDGAFGFPGIPAD
jgi:hypothetical protein